MGPRASASCWAPYRECSRGGVEPPTPRFSGMGNTHGFRCLEPPLCPFCARPGLRIPRRRRGDGCARRAVVELGPDMAAPSPWLPFRATSPVDRQPPRVDLRATTPALAWRSALASKRKSAHLHRSRCRTRGGLSGIRSRHRFEEIQALGAPRFDVVGKHWGDGEWSCRDFGGLAHGWLPSGAWRGERHDWSRRLMALGRRRAWPGCGRCRSSPIRM